MFYILYYTIKFCTCDLASFIANEKNIISTNLLSVNTDAASCHIFLIYTLHTWTLGTPVVSVSNSLRLIKAKSYLL